LVWGAIPYQPTKNNLREIIMANKKSTAKSIPIVKKKDAVLRCEKNIKFIENLIANGHNTPENHIRLAKLKVDLEAVSK
jgi:hypothetical protein